MEITPEELFLFVNKSFLLRGEACCKEGLIELISIEPHQAHAWAVGTKAYKVFLRRIDEKILEGDCTCPAFKEFGTCKHLAAVGYALIKHYDGGYEPSEEYFERMSFFRCRKISLV